MAEFNLPIRDYANKPSTATLPVADAISDLSLTQLFTSVGLVTTGAIGKTTLDKAVPKDVGPGGNAANSDAQRESKWLFTYHDTLYPDEIYTMEIPCPDYTLRPAGSDNIDLSAGAGLAFKTAFQTVVVSPRRGNVCVLDEGILLGRNL